MLLPAAQVGVSNNPPGCVPYNLTADAKIPRCPQQCAVQGLAGAANRTDGVRLERSEMPSLPAHACFHGCTYKLYPGGGPVDRCLVCLPPGVQQRCWRRALLKIWRTRPVLQVLQTPGCALQGFTSRKPVAGPTGQNMHGAIWQAYGFHVQCCPCHASCPRFKPCCWRRWCSRWSRGRTRRISRTCMWRAGPCAPGRRITTSPAQSTAHSAAG